MTYCDYEWMSDFTYEGIMTFLQTHLVSVQADRLQIAQADRLLVMGSIDPGTSQVDLQPMFIIPDAGDVLPPTPGPYAIVLRTAAGTERARYPFTPQGMHDGPAHPTALLQRERELLAITELVQYVAGTSRVDIEGPSGLLKTVTAGPSDPKVTVVSPNGGETLAGDTIPVSWTASDPDGDPLWFNVQYSPDNGASWEMVAQNLTETSVVLDASNVVAGAQGLFRVWASDGIHTDYDQSDAPFTVPNRPPQVAILAPANGVTVALSQTVALEGEVYDVDAGNLPEGQIEWRSNRDGLLGNGASLSVASLSVGTHTITLRADDGQGGVGTANITVHVVADVSEVPVPNALRTDPANLVFYPAAGVNARPLAIENDNSANAISWNATAGAPWVQLGSASGMTPAEITVTCLGQGLALGTHTTQITLTSATLPGEVLHVLVEARVENVARLPLVLRR